ncbi:MAG: hypothetical protein Q3976_00850 [Corynebacterium sp.]|nr:hypothetical protein [Corynebacterium sp.]
MNHPDQAGMIYLPSCVYEVLENSETQYCELILIVNSFSEQTRLACIGMNSKLWHDPAGPWIGYAS